MVNAFFYSNIAVATTLSGNINNSVTTATVAATTGWPTSYPFIIAIDFGAANEELVQVTNNAAGTLTIVRGFGGTSAVSHSIGAVVRHAYNAQDATDFRTHEAATSSVHGVTGALVGATQAQTLTNKTLTSPTINGGALSGTFTGTPTFSGAVVLSGTPSISTGAALAGTFTGTPTFSGNVTHSGEIILTNLLRGSRGAAGDSQYETRVTADANARWYMTADGRMRWGSGAAVTDISVYRDSASALATDGLFRTYRTLSTDAAMSSYQTGDANARWYRQANGAMWWGPGSATQDTNLYRSAVGVLATDSIFDAQVETETTGVTVPGTFSVNSFNGRRTCNVANIQIQLSYSGSTITADSAGNITDTLACTLPAGWRPAAVQTAPYDKSGVAAGTVTILTDGTCTLKTLAPTATIASGSTINFSATFIL